MPKVLTDLSEWGQDGIHFDESWKRFHAKDHAVGVPDDPPVATKNLLLQIRLKLGSDQRRSDKHHSASDQDYRDRDKDHRRSERWVAGDFVDDFRAAQRSSIRSSA